MSGGYTACPIHSPPPPGHSTHQKQSTPASSEKHLTGLRHKALPVSIGFSTVLQSHAEVLGLLANPRIHPEPTLISPETPDYACDYSALTTWQFCSCPKRCPRAACVVLKAVRFPTEQTQVLSGLRQDTHLHSPGRHLRQLCVDFQKPRGPFQILSNLLSLSQSHSLPIYLLAILSPCEERAQLFLPIKT